MKSLGKLKSTRGQQMLEYSAIFILVMAGIILMRPYVIRSWNASMKGYEDSVLDSYRDPLLTYTGTVDLPGCDCRWQVRGCGQGTTPPPAGVQPNDCRRTEMIYDFICDPTCTQQERQTALGSNTVTLRCEIDDNCCDSWDPANPDQWAPSTFQRLFCGANANPPCPDGSYLRTRECGNRNASTSCSPQDLQQINDGVCDCVPHTLCQFDCLYDPTPQNPNSGDEEPPFINIRNVLNPNDDLSNYCCNSRGTEMDNNALPCDNHNVTYLSNEAGCTDTRKCQVVCYYPAKLRPNYTVPTLLCPP